MKTSRRAFLAQATAAMLATSVAPLTPAIDTHTHFYDPTRPQGVPWPKPDDRLLYQTYLPRQFRALTAQHYVVGTVVVEASPWLEDNQWILDLAKDDPNLVGFIGNLELGVPEFAARLKRFRANPLFRGLRLGERALLKGLSERGFVDDLRRLGEQRLTLDLLGGPALLNAVPQVAKLAPGVRIVIDHLPFNVWDGDAAAMRRAMAEVARLPHVYAKVSNVARRVNDHVVTEQAFYRPGLDALWEAFGADRVVFGSNWPVSERVAPYAVVYKIVADYVATKEQPAAEKFFWRNSHAAYDWQPRGAAANLVKR